MILSIIPIFLCVSLVSNIIWHSDGYSVNDTKTLYADVLKGYDPRVRPTLNQSSQTVLGVSFHLLSLGDFNEVDAVFTVTGIIYTTWLDELITWSPESYGGIDNLLFSTTEVWHPHFLLAFPKEKFASEFENWNKVKITHEGFAQLSAAEIFKTKCSVDITYFPFDKQVCELVFLASGYTSWDIYLTMHSKHVHEHYSGDHGEWEIVSNSSFSYSDYLPEPYMKFTFNLERNPSYFVLNIIIPIFVLSMLNILIFVLPPQSGERVSFGITVLLAFAVFLTIVGENLPKASKNMSILSYYIVVNLSLSALMCVLAILNLRIYFKEKEERFPWWTKIAIVLTCSRCKIPNRKLYGRNEDYKEKARTEQPYSAELTDTQKLSWEDISSMLDKLCFVLFVVLTLVNAIYFLIMIHFNNNSQNHSAI